MRGSGDAALLIVTRGIRGFVDGAIAVALAAYFTLLGWSGARIGVLVTTMLLGSAVVTLLVGVRGHRFTRRTILLAAAATNVVTGIVYASTTAFAVLLVVGFIGTLNPTGGDLSVFLPIEQSLIPATVAPERRTSTFATYAFAGSITVAFGSLAAGLPEWLARRTDVSERDALRAVFLVYALVGVVVFLIYRTVSTRLEPPPTERAAPLRESRSIVHRLAALFGLDAFGGGFVVQSLLALWLFRRFDLSLAAAGALLFWTGVCAAFSAFVSARIARRIGLVRTMVFTHIPANVFLVLAAFMPNLPLAVTFLVLRSLLSQMDVPVRNSYVMAVVTPAERAAAASVTSVPRSLAGALPPLAAGWMLDRSTFGWPLVLAGVLKIVYDLLLLAMFRNVRPPEELAAAK